MTEKNCPIISYQQRYAYEKYCMKETCGFWDEERNQCCLKTLALAVAAKPGNNGGQETPSHAQPKDMVDRYIYQQQPDMIIRGSM